jgi:hypothetical protein
MTPMEEVMTKRELPTSGRPAGPPPRPAPEATYDLAWRYGRDLARLHMVDPEKLFFFWEVTDETARRAAGRPGKLSARLVHLPGKEGGTERTAHTAEGVFAVMNWYFEVEPLARYRGEVGWLGADGTFEPWLVSNLIETPRLSVNMTGEVVWRIGGKKKQTRSSPRGDSMILGPDEHPSERPSDAASAAGARRRQAIREITRQAWSGTTAAWSRTAIPQRKGDGQ